MQIRPPFKIHTGLENTHTLPRLQMSRSLAAADSLHHRRDKDGVPARRTTLLSHRPTGFSNLASQLRRGKQSAVTGLCAVAETGIGTASNIPGARSAPAPCSGATELLCYTCRRSSHAGRDPINKQSGLERGLAVAGWRSKPWRDHAPNPAKERFAHVEELAKCEFIRWGGNGCAAATGSMAAGSRVSQPRTH